MVRPAERRPALLSRLRNYLAERARHKAALVRTNRLLADQRKAVRDLEKHGKNLVNGYCPPHLSGWQTAVEIASGRSPSKRQQLLEEALSNHRLIVSAAEKQLRIVKSKGKRD